jgi:EmrB/QacA subfamily drug resistance transporter
MAVRRPTFKTVTTSRPRVVLTICILASALAFIDGSIVNIALPAISRSLTADTDALQWVLNAYLLPLTAFLLLGGALGDRYGLWRMLLVGIGIFLVASLGCAAAPNMTILLIARSVQGAGAAVLLPSSLAILGTSFQDEERGRAVGIWAAVSAMAGAIGPALGGWLIDIAGWRTVFLINLPVGLIAIFLALAVMPRGASSLSKAPLDLRGAVSATVMLGVLVWGLIVGTGPKGWNGMVTAALMLSFAAGIVFVVTEVAKGNDAMAPAALFGSRALVGLNCLTFLLYGALGAFLILLPFFLIEAADYGATAAGVALLPLPLVMTLTGPLMGTLAGRYGSRTLLTTGSLLMALGLLLCVRIDQNAAYVSQVLPCMIVASFGMSAAAAPLTTAILSSVDAQHSGSASGLNSALARAGNLVAAALIGTVLAARGELLVFRFHMAAIVGAAAALLAAAFALWSLASKKSGCAHKGTQ